MKIKGFKQWLDDLGRNERCPCPPNYTTFLETHDRTCVCVPVEDMRRVECRIRCRDDLDESAKEALVLNRPVEFNRTGSVTSRTTGSGIFLHIGDGKFFQVPPSKHQWVWDIISDRLMAS